MQEDKIREFLNSGLLNIRFIERELGWSSNTLHNYRHGRSLPKERLENLISYISKIGYQL